MVDYVKPIDLDALPKTKSKGGLQNMLKNVTKEMYRRNYELAQTNRTLSVLRSIDNIALATHENLYIFCEKLSEAIVKTAEFPFACILTVSPSVHKLENFRGIAANTNLTEDIKTKLSELLINTHAHWYRSERKIETITADSLFMNGLTLVSPDTSRERTDIKELLGTTLKVKSLVVAKLSSSQKIVGVMVIGFQQDHKAITKEDMDLITRLGDSIGVAVENKLLFEENKLVAAQLRKANVKLKALDESKDEFISMASHQLRTPLTSVKGYISIILDGDAGKISAKQKDLLHQAFFSSQKMVDLIADLLNVSRLRTGKFVIEPKPTNLDTIIRGEIDQLTETAKAKKVTLTYNKPKDFPVLMFDETKIRQVIMNFADNAIYYTPTGGHIQVSLVENPETVEFKVIDDGIGVPRSEQHHLFTKFYRAGNARQTRPDGTGLGLFMAKKVIMAEGGSVIFESEEGKGSTFGFMFSKRKMTPTKDQLTKAVGTQATGQPKKS